MVQYGNTPNSFKVKWYLWVWNNLFRTLPTRKVLGTRLLRKIANTTIKLRGWPRQYEFGTALSYEESLKVWGISSKPPIADFGSWNRWQRSLQTGVFDQILPTCPSPCCPRFGWSVEIINPLFLSISSPDHFYSLWSLSF